MLDKAVEDRIFASLNFREGDRVPIWGYIDNYGIYKHFAGDEKDYTRGMVKVYHELGIDLCRGFGSSFAPSDEGETNDYSIILGRTRWKTKYPINSLEDLKTYEPHRITQEQIDGWVVHEKRMQELFAPYTSMWPAAGADSTPHTI